jgi:hypothetical protein
MNKALLISCLILALTSCFSRQNRKNNEYSNLSTTKKSRLRIDKTMNENDLIGVWWDANDKEAPSATFMITDSTIFYPDQEGQSYFKYQIKNDSMSIYFNEYQSISKIEKLTMDTLILITNGNKITLYKGQN